MRSQITALEDEWRQKWECSDLLLRTFQYVHCLAFLGSLRVVFADCVSFPLEIGQILTVLSLNLT